jgi:Flp pilus assembly protein TadD
LRINPHSSSAFGNRGLVYRKLGNFEKALADFDKAIKINPSNVQALNSRGVLYAMRDDLPMAVKDFKRASSLGDQRGRENYEHAVKLLKGRAVR